MSNTASNNNRIAKNTAFLYLRMLLIMAVSLYTSRVILEVLGVVDFGIYNVVAGIVTMSSFISASMSSAIQRFLSFEIGKNNTKNIGKVFAMSINIHIVLMIIILIVAETIGLWFVNYKMVIPEDRILAANVVYQFSIFTFLTNVISVPYNAAIMAFEKMKAFAYIGLVEVSLKLGAVVSLSFFDYDKLSIYSFLIFLISFCIRLLYGFYVKLKIKECKFYWFWNRTLFKKLLSFAGWNFWGNIAEVTSNQGINIILNIFFGPAVNAARAIAFQVYMALNSFVANFQMALKPQIIKSYAADNNSYMHLLVINGAKYSFFLMLLMCGPLIIYMPQVLEIWLGEYPEYTIVFCRLILVETLINSISGTLMSAVQATGKIKMYFTVVGGVLILILPVSLFLFELGMSAEFTFYVSISFSFFAFLCRLFIVCRLIKLSKFLFLKRVIFPIIMVTATFILGYYLLIRNLSDNLIYTIFQNLIFISVVITSIIVLGLSRMEKKLILSKINNYIKIN